MFDDLLSLFPAAAGPPLLACAAESVLPVVAGPLAVLVGVVVEFFNPE